MKNISFKTRGRRKGFTLLEILVVILIIVILVTFVVQAMNWVKASQAEKTASIMVNRISMGLQEYKSDMGYFPGGNGDAVSTHELYKALYDDADNDGKPDHGAERVYVAELDPFVQGKDPWAAITGESNGKIVIIDPWGKALRYRLGFQEKDEKGKEGEGFNPDFDLWSCGIDGETDLNNSKKTGVNTDDVGNIK